MITLPSPSEDELESVQPLFNLICKQIEENNGKINFSDYMETVLYTPNLGYYTSDRPIFGHQGDFITAPELTPLFSRCIARQVQEVFAQFDDVPDILEFGAGAGTMACDLLLELESLKQLPNRYYISEISHTLQERQKAQISDLAPHLLDKVVWINQLPESFSGVILGNEILDAMPCHRIRLNKNGEHEELFVGYENQRLQWSTDAPINETLKAKADAIYEKYGEAMPDHYETEINTYVEQWIKEIAGVLKKGLILLIDYGFSEQEYMRAERHEGTLMCHYKHMAHGNPLTHVGLQDITSHVNFTNVAEVAFESDLDILGFTNQSYFLISCGLENLLNEVDVEDTKLFLQQTQPVKQLILPDEMGELFKVIGLGKEIEVDLLGFSTRNMLERL